MQMSIIRSARYIGERILFRYGSATSTCSRLCSSSSWVLFAEPRSPLSKTMGVGMISLPSSNYQQVRTVKRGTEYQPKNIKRKRTHGWIKRISTQGGIEVILRRILKGRRSLSH